MLNCRGAQQRTPRPEKMPTEEKCLLVPLKSTTGAALELGGVPHPLFQLATEAMKIRYMPYLATTPDACMMTTRVAIIFSPSTR